MDETLVPFAFTMSIEGTDVLEIEGKVTITGTPQDYEIGDIVVNGVREPSAMNRKYEHIMIKLMPETRPGTPYRLHGFIKKWLREQKDEEIRRWLEVLEEKD